MIPIKELSIGNWVYATRITEKPVQIEGFEQTHIETLTLRTEDNLFIAREKWSFIEPIPITPEILKKNGFEEWRDDWLICDCDPYNIYFKEQKENWILRYKSLLESEGFILINNIHQLQNTLTLLGIEKEIIL